MIIHFLRKWEIMVENNQYNQKSAKTEEFTEMLQKQKCFYSDKRLDFLVHIVYNTNTKNNLRKRVRAVNPQRFTVSDC